MTAVDQDELWIATNAVKIAAGEIMGEIFGGKFMNLITGPMCEKMALAVLVALAEKKAGKII